MEFEKVVILYALQTLFSKAHFIASISFLNKESSLEAVNKGVKLLDVILSFRCFIPMSFVCFCFRIL